jgi:predicted phosphodiesterase
MQISYGTGCNAKTILLVHASARSIDEYVHEDYPEIDPIRMLRKNNADVIVMGHTHLHYIRTFTGGKFAVNTGSVGPSKEKRISAAYLMLTIASRVLNLKSSGSPIQ